MVEAAGIEPASEDCATGTSTCLVGTFDLMNRAARRQTSQFTSLLEFHLGSKAAPSAIPLVRRFFPGERTHQRETGCL